MEEINEDDIREAYENHPIMPIEDVIEAMGEYITEVIVKNAEWTAFHIENQPKNEKFTIADYWF